MVQNVRDAGERPRHHAGYHAPVSFHRVRERLPDCALRPVRQSDPGLELIQSSASRPPLVTKNSVPSDSALVERAVELARALQSRATELQTPAERRQQAELDRMLQTPADKVTLVQLTDEAFRCRTPSRTVEHL